MQLIGVAHALGWLLLLLAGAMLVPAGFAFSFAETAELRAFLASAAALGFLGGGVVFALEGKVRKFARRQGLVLVVLIWIVVPAAATIPLTLSSLEESASKLFFEAVSGFTTTGATIFVDLSRVPRAVIVWRASLQWLGGLTTLVSLALLLDPLLGARSIDPRKRSVRRDPGNGGLMRAATVRAVVSFYAGMTVLCAGALSASGLPNFDAFALALSTVSTGGFMPRNGTIELYGAPFASAVLALFMFAGAVSLVWIKGVVTFRRALTGASREPAWIAAAMLLLGLALTASMLPAMNETGPGALAQSFALSLASAASLISTTGFAISERTLGDLPYMIALGICIVGGGRLSTAGGLKFHRVGTMLRHAAAELHRLIYPHGISRWSHELLPPGKGPERAAWVTFSTLILSIVALTLVLSLSSIALPHALLAAVSAIGNIGPAYGLVSVPVEGVAPDYGDMTDAARLALAAGMVLGRMEVLALLSLVNIAYWRA